MNKIKISSLEFKLNEILDLDNSNFEKMSNLEQEKQADNRVIEQLKNMEPRRASQ